MVTDLLERADVLGGDAQFDVCTSAGRPAQDGDASPSGQARAERRYRHGDIRRHISVVQRPDGPMPVLKTLQTNACAKDCFYCPFRAGRDFRREAFTPEELARLTDQLYRARMVRGLFLSSGVVGGDDYSMGQIIATGEILREKYAFRGYLHLKLMPAASTAAVERALVLADRVSVNIEAPNTERLARLTSTKDLDGDLLAPLVKVRDMLRRSAGRAGGDAGGRALRRVSRTTQLVVGAAGESDAEILATTARLYGDLGLARVYYSAFRPVPDTPLDGQPPEDPNRARRLYQADFLVRDYGFTPDDLPLDGRGRLPAGVDPKLAWAQAHPERFPVELTHADRAALLRVPGIGPKSVARVLAARRGGRLRHASDLRGLGVHAERVLPWITVGGKAPPRQLPLPAPGGGP